MVTGAKPETPGRSIPGRAANGSFSAREIEDFDLQQKTHAESLLRRPLI
jgi:hypothetical protein